MYTDEGDIPVEITPPDSGKMQPDKPKRDHAPCWHRTGLISNLTGGDEVRCCWCGVYSGWEEVQQGIHGHGTFAPPKIIRTIREVTHTAKVKP